MPTDYLRNTRKKKTCFAQVSEVEKQLWARIQSHGVLDTGVKGLYDKACCIYEKLFLSDNELSELQNIEYLLWRLHYKHIDEFRKTLCQTAATIEEKLATKVDITMNKVNVHMEGFKLFLSEATKFYRDLIRSIKRYNGLFDEPWFYKNDGESGRIEQKKLHKCQFVCHRLCICLGDLARYLELYEKPSHHQRNWSVAASYYLEAAKIYPDGGNPQNQLAVLATYIGDDFLALYHCIRSLAVEEPFPDALQNLMLLFERNRSSNIDSLKHEAYDFAKPSDWISSSCEELSDGTSTNRRTSKVAGCDPCAASDFCTLFIRMTSFFFLESSQESFNSTLFSTLREFEALLALDVGELSSALQSYQTMHLLKAGPYRALHIVSVLLFIIYNLTADPERKLWKPTGDMQQSELVKLSSTVTFTFMGRLVDRCLKGSPVVYFPLLPALLVFVEWLAGAIGKLKADDEKCEKAMCYFFGSFVKLLNYLQDNRAQINSPSCIALWEDYELRGFIPLSPTHERLDFSSNWEDEINYKMKNDYRAHRIVHAAIKIAGRASDNALNWLSYDETGRKFGVLEARGFVYRDDLQDRKSFPYVQPKEPHQQIDRGNCNAGEEEEDIVFKPLARHNSEPIKLKDGPITGPSDDCLRRASSLLVAENRNSSTSRPSTLSASPNNRKAQSEYQQKSSMSSTVSESIIAAGPPSLSSWVLSGDITKGIGTERTVLKSIAETTSNELRNLSLTTDGSSIFVSPVTCSSSYISPSPSAPLLVPTAVRVIDTSPDFCLQSPSTSEACGFEGSSYVQDIHQGGPGIPSFIDRSSPSLASTDSRLWGGSQLPKLSTDNSQRANEHTIQDQNHAPRNLNSIYGSGASGFGLLDHWSHNDPLASLPKLSFEGSPPLFHPSPSLLHGLHEQRRDIRLSDYQKPRPCVTPIVPDARPEPQPLLQYLKQRERQLQQESKITGPYYMKK